jgi:hypothetical protein
MKVKKIIKFYKLFQKKKNNNQKNIDQNRNTNKLKSYFEKLESQAMK